MSAHAIPATARSQGYLRDFACIYRPIPYPRGDGNDDLIIGGENGLHFVAVSDNKGSLRLSHAGPVLQTSAQLVTGQTPTVSISDWDTDG